MSFSGSFPSALYLENGHLFEGLGFGSKKPNGGELIFNTGMTGYQEVFTDPSYYKQIVTMTYPHIGNTGINLEDVESKALYLQGVVVREYCDQPSNWRSKKTLSQYLEQANVPAISEVDTRQITQILREEGAQRAVIFSTEGVSDVKAEAKKLVNEVPSMEGLELVSEVSCKEDYVFHSGSGPLAVVYDFGVKINILRNLVHQKCRVHVVPYNTPAEKVLSMKPALVVLSNGPGDPATVNNVVPNIQALIGKVPILAICMGHQLLARALNVPTYKLKFGHHGVNHPVRDERTGRVMITSQNHGFCVDREKLEKAHPDCKVSHIHLNDGTLAGFTSDSMRFLSTQFHPEAAPGPSDANVLFQDFLARFVR